MSECKLTGGWFGYIRQMAKELTRFEEKVYTVVKKIPFGETRTYKWVAEKIGSPNASKAVGNALNKNPFPIIVPCHRVVNSSGYPGKYAFGPGLKKKFLASEKATKCCQKYRKKLKNWSVN